MSDSEMFALSWMRQHKAHKKAKVYASELIQAAWRLHQLRVKSPEEVTLEVELFFDSLIRRHQKYRYEQLCHHDSPLFCLSNGLQGGM